MPGCWTWWSTSNQPQLVPPLSGNEQGGNPTRNLLVIAPLGHDKQVEGLVEIFQRPNTQPNTQRGYLKFLLQMCEIAGEWFKNRKLSHLSDRHSLWAQADQFARLVHDSLDIRETAYTIVNEGRKLIGCDRVSICMQRGGVCKVEAISGQDTLDNRSNVVYTSARWPREWSPRARHCGTTAPPKTCRRRSRRRRKIRRRVVHQIDDHHAAPQAAARRRPHPQSRWRTRSCRPAKSSAR